MKIETDDSALNVFRFVGHTTYWEDNVTRGLLSVITRSPAGGLILREILDRCANTAEGSARAELKQAVADLCQVNVRWQSPFTQDSDETSFTGFAVLVSLAPAVPEEAPRGAATDKSTGRFDAVLACQSGGCWFEVVLEAKLYAGVGSEQWNRYREKLRGELRGKQCLTAHLAWSEVIDILDTLPTAAKNDPIVADYLEYLADMYWLTGFRGFSQDDFTVEKRARRRWRLRQLAAALVKSEEPEPAGIVGYRELRGGLDIDLYTQDQLRLIGHTGLHSWQDNSLGLKLIVGALNVQDDDALWRVLKSGSGRADAPYWTFRGVQALLGLDKQEVARRIAETTRELKGSLSACVMFRCWFHRFKEEIIFSRTWHNLSEDAWDEVDAALRMGEPVDGRRVTDDSLNAMLQFLEGNERHKVEKVRSELQSLQQTRRPSHHAVLILFSDFDLAKMTSLEPDEQVQQARRRLECLTRLLRDLSEMASRREGT